MEASEAQKRQASLQDMQSQLGKAVEARQQLESQQQENLGVQKEFKNLDEGANVYKLIGPVLMKQDHVEAVAAVDGRLEFIDREIKRVEKQIKDLQDNAQRLQGEMMKAQNQTAQQEA